MVKEAKAVVMLRLKQAMVDLAAARGREEQAARDREFAIFDAWKAGVTQVELSSQTGMTQPQISKICGRIARQEGGVPA